MNFKEDQENFSYLTGLGLPRGDEALEENEEVGKTRDGVTRIS